MISFENTEVAFKSKSNKDLRRAYLLFKAIGSPRMVKFGKWATKTSFSIGLPISGMIKATIFKQFCGGESIEECAATTEALGQFGIGTILDYSVEGKTSDEDFEKTTLEIIDTILFAAKRKHIPFAVFKVTGISQFAILEAANESEAHLNEVDLAKYHEIEQRIDRICKAAFDAGIPVFIDAEESWIQDVIDRLALKMMRKYNQQRAIVYNTIQMYRHDRYDFLAQQIEIAKKENIHLGIKLVRGAYMEKERARAVQKGYPSPIQKDKKSSDDDFNKAVELLLANINCIELCAGTHNEDSSLLLAELMTKYSIKSNDHRIWFAQLLGMSDHISYNLAHHGFNVAKYVPYGPVKEVMPYLLRRADENTSVAGQTSRELSLIMKERKRRKQK
ncbi:MAG: proline dehydrogenase family protein [Bacteroidota bacterium]